MSGTRRRKAHDRLVDLVTGFQSGEQWQAALAAAARFHKYSFANALLIVASHAAAYAQGRVPDPVPDLVAGYRTWQGLGRQVQAGQHGHTILCPRTRLLREAVTAAGDCRTLARGEHPGPGESLRQRTALVGWSTGTVFSMSQTDGADLPMPPFPMLLSGQAPPGLWEGLAAQVHAAGYALHNAPDADALRGANGITNVTDRTVTVRADLDDAGRCKTLAHELGHILIHMPPATDDTNPQPATASGGVCRGIAEVEAESVAFIVGAAHGMDTSAYTLPYVATWAGGANPAATVRSTAERVLRAARTILDRLDTPHGCGGQPPAPVPDDGPSKRPNRRPTRTPHISMASSLAAVPMAP